MDNLESLDCQRYQRQIDEDAQSGELMAHLRNCPACQTLFRSHQDVEASIRSLPKVEAPPSFHADVMRRIDCLEKPASNTVPFLTSWQGRSVAAIALVAGLAVMAMQLSPIQTSPSVQSQSTMLASRTTIPTEDPAYIQWMNNDSTDTLSDVVGF
jgi:anti-sigma factor RsiW